MSKRRGELERELAEAQAEHEVTMRERVAAREELEREGARWRRPSDRPPAAEETPLSWAMVPA